MTLDEKIEDALADLHRIADALERIANGAAVAVAVFDRIVGALERIANSLRKETK